jgi:hypothetical protein
MRLLDIHTLGFRWFAEVPKDQPYVILSHVWGEEELTYEEHEAWLTARKSDPDLAEPDTAGFRKLVSFCRVCERDYHTVTVHFEGRHGHNAKTFVMAQRKDAQDDAIGSIPDSWRSDEQNYEAPTVLAPKEVQWVWMDTCCIDKRRSADLSEAINSMYQWHRDAACCIAYLSDVQSGRSEHGTTPKEHAEHSKWFTRGWTLQELIAPVEVWFYDADWKPFWSRNGAHLAIASITSIDYHVLMMQPTSDTLYRIPVAVRLSWAANRETTRVEDRAYSLMGLLDINMPLMYGEGDKAFGRLQETFLKQTVDHSILIWNRPDWPNERKPSMENYGAGPKLLESFKPLRFPDLRLEPPRCKFSIFMSSSNMHL